MNAITVVVLIFSILGAVDYLLGNKIGIVKEYATAFSLFCPMALSMIGMLTVAPAFGVWLSPVFDGFYTLFGIDPSILPASLFANDMGGMTLARAICRSREIGDFNAFVVASMMGCVISYTVPFSLGIVKREQHRELFFGILCGIVTIPVGCFAAGLLCGIGLLPLLIDLLPLVILSLVVGAGLILLPNASIKAFSVFGMLMKTISILGLVAAIFTFLTGVEISPHFDSFENSALVCANACVTLTGALPLMLLLSRFLSRPLTFLGKRVGIDPVSAIALLGTLVTNSSTFGVMERMNKRGAVLNSAFAVSAAFVFGAHIAFTMAFESAYVLPMIVGKLAAGLCAVFLAFFLYKEDRAINTPTVTEDGGES